MALPRRKQKAKKRSERPDSKTWRKKRSDFPPPECPSTGKTPYRSVPAAERAMLRMQYLLGPDDDKPRRVYPCDDCGKFHLTKHAEWEDR